MRATERHVHIDGPLHTGASRQTETCATSNQEVPNFCRVRHYMPCTAICCASEGGRKVTSMLHSEGVHTSMHHRACITAQPRAAPCFSFLLLVQTYPRDVNIYARCMQPDMNTRCMQPHLAVLQCKQQNTSQIKRRGCRSEIRQHAWMDSQHRAMYTSTRRPSVAMHSRKCWLSNKPPQTALRCLQSVSIMVSSDQT